MVWIRGLLALAAASYAAAEQQPFALPQDVVESPLSGRFLHITDMHFDKFYRQNSAVVSSCHHDKPHDKHGGDWRAGHWGTSVSDCDSPRWLGNATLDWIVRNWNSSSSDKDNSAQPVDMFDFVLWTGDSARHDQDALMPRTSEEILDSNRFAVSLMESYFPDIPVVPNFGNNDIAMHNIMPRGPTDELRAFREIWRRHIPEDQTDAFLQGGFYAKDLVPGHLGVISLNTLYFYDSNKAVDGCPRRSRGSPNEETDIGTLQLEWMTERLLDFRRRNMQVYIIGHVPPTAGNYFPRCFDVYTEMVIRFQDTVVGQIFGHMNLDMFFIQESSLAASTEDFDTHTSGKSVLMKPIEEDLRLDFESLPGSARTNMNYYSTFYVAPSVVPTYLPSVRVWTYNTTPVHDNRPGLFSTPAEERQALLDFVLYDSCEVGDPDPDCAEDAPRAPVQDTVETLKKGRKHSRPKHRKKHRHGRLPRYASPHSPSRTNTFLTPLGYSQWVLNLPKANREYDQLLKNNGSEAAAMQTLDFDLEYTTYCDATLWHAFFDQEEQTSSSTHRHHSSPSEHHIPVPYHLLERALASLDMDSPLKCRKGKCHVRRAVRYLTEYEREDMTLKSSMDLGRQLVLDRKLWKRFVHRMYTNSLLIN